jgi:hypothetical protein
MVGGSGTVTAGTTEFDVPDDGPAPSAFDAVTWHVYVFPFVSPFTMIGLAEPVAPPGEPPLDD